jgi:hypothetical protein
MEEHAEDELVLRLTVEHLLKAKSWPKLAYIHRRIHQDLGDEVQVREVARRLAPHPLFSGYHDLEDVFAPPLTALAAVREADVLIDALLDLIVYARDKYLSSSGEVEIRGEEFAESAKVRGEVAAAVRELAHAVPFLTHGGGSGPEGWYVRVSDDVVRWSGMSTRQELLERLGAIEEENRQQYAAIADAKARMVGVKPAPIESEEEVEVGAMLQPTRYFQGVALRLGGGMASVADDVSFPPRKSGIPDLSHLYSKNILPLILNITLRAQSTTNHPSLAYTAAYVRLVDKGVREYESARRSLEEFVETGSEHLTPYFRAADHLENALNSVRRAIRYARRIRRDRESLQVEKSELPTQDDEDRIAGFRDAAEHADNQVATGTLGEGDAVILTLHELTFSIGNIEASYEWLARLLTKLHVLSSRVAGVVTRPNAPGRK